MTHSSVLAAFQNEKFGRLRQPDSRRRVGTQFITEGCQVALKRSRHGMISSVRHQSYDLYSLSGLDIPTKSAPESDLKGAVRSRQPTCAPPYSRTPHFKYRRYRKVKLERPQPCRIRSPTVHHPSAGCRSGHAHGKSGVGQY